MFWVSVLSPIALLLLWELAAAERWIRVAFYPPPSALARPFWAMAQRGELWSHTSITLVRLFWTFLLAVVLGIGLGLLMGTSRTTRQALDPALTILYPIPAVLFFPILAIILGRGELALVLTGTITPLIIVAVSTMAAVRGIDRTLVEAGRNFGATGWRFFFKVLLPGVLPLAFVGARVGLGMAVILVIALEMVGAQRGLGYLLWSSWSILQVEVTYVALVCVGVLGLLATYGLDLLGRRLMPWQEEYLHRKGGA